MGKSITAIGDRMSLPARLAQSDSPAPASGKLGQEVPDLGVLPAQAEELTRELFEWFRDDSLSALAGIGLGVGLYFLLLFLRGLARRRLKRADFGSWNWVLLKVLAKTRSFFLVPAAAKLVAALFATPPSWLALITFLFTIAAAVQGAFWVREFLISLVERKASAGDAAEAGSIGSAVGILTVIINVLVWTVAAIILLDNLGVNVTGLVAGLGIGGIAIGLAAQGIFSDLFAALSILLDRPFAKGDWIQVGGPQGVVGRVEHIGLKTTRLRALSGEMVVLSNANLLNQQINNLADFRQRRVVLLVEVIYQTDPTLLENIPDELRSIIEAQPLCRFDRAHILQFAPSGIQYELVFIVQDPGLLPMLEARHKVAIGIVRRFHELGIEFAFPAQVSYLAGPDGRIVEPHPETGPPVRPAHLGGRRPAGSRTGPATG